MQQKLQDRPTAIPARVRNALTAMYVGLACSVLAAIATLVDQTLVDGISDELWKAYPDYTAAEVRGEESAVVTYLFALSAVGVGGWLWMIRATRRAHRRTRAVATSILGLALCIALANGYVPMPGFLATSVWLPCIAGLVAVGLLWTRDSSAYLASRD